MNPIGEAPHFIRPGKDHFFKNLVKEVHENVLRNKKPQRQNIIKTLGILIAFISFYSCILLFGNNTSLLITFYILMGFSMIILFVNAVHDAAHDALFQTKKQNRLFCYIIELFGSNSEIWIQRHLLLHHPYPSIQNWDCDVKQSDIVKIFPNSPWYKFHKYQHIYMFFLYPLYTLIWIFVRDFKDFFGTKDNYLKRVYTIARIEYAKLFIAKIFNLFYMLLIPYWVLNQSIGIILSAWIIMHITSSLLGVVALISTHADEDAVFPLPPPDGDMQTTWVEHQMTVTKDFNPGNPITDFLYGGFSHHTAHHLFPTVGHTYYPEITPIIQKYSKEYDLPYTSRSAFNAIKSHFILLKNSGKGNSLFSAREL